MPNVRFSVVIPTRQRANTLCHTLKTCLSQAFENFEIVVSDNCSSPETEHVVGSFGSDKIRYVRSDSLLAMSDNWELALSHASGEYVIFIGDDDALMPNALAHIDVLLETLNTKALRLEFADYHWPDVAIPEIANRLSLPLPRGNERFYSPQAISNVANGNWSFTKLPMIYRSAIHRDLISALKQKTGRVFNTKIPDIYSGFAFAHLCKEYYASGQALCINGASSKSNGIATVYSEEETEIKHEFVNLNRAAGFSVHTKVPDIPSVIPAIVAEEFMWAKELLFPDNTSLSLDRERLARNCINGIERFDYRTWMRFMTAIHESLRDDPNLYNWFEVNYLTKLNNGEGAHRIKPLNWQWQPGYYGDRLLLNMSDFAIQDIHAVSDFCGKLLGNHIHVAPPDIPTVMQMNVIRRFLREVRKILT